MPKQTHKAQLDALDSENTFLTVEVTGVVTSMGVVEGEIAAIHTELVTLGVASLANGVFSFANAAGKLTGSLIGTSASFTSLTVNGKVLQQPHQ